MFHTGEAKSKRGLMSDMRSDVMNSGERHRVDLARFAATPPALAAVSLMWV